jgi:hypothetical protein
MSADGSRTVTLSADSVARLEELVAHRNRSRGKLLTPQHTLDEVLSWALLRQYNRTRAVIRHAHALKGKDYPISPLEARPADPRDRIDDD